MTAQERCSGDRRRGARRGGLDCLGQGRPADLQPSAVEQTSWNRRRDTARACCLILAARSAGASGATSLVGTAAA